MAGRALALALGLATTGIVHGQSAGTIPATRATALDGHTVSLPQNLGTHATVLILGFGRHSADATTPWEKAVRTQLAQAPAIAFYDMAMLAEVPGFVRPMVVSSIRHKVPPVLQPNFLPLTGEEDAWKHAAGYTPDQPDAAYILLVDHTGHILWSTHAAFTDAGFADLTRRAHAAAQ
jgi:hypothetical protein